VNVVRFFRGTFAVHAFAASQVSMVSFEQKRFHANEFAFAQILQGLAIAGLVAEP